MLPYNPLPSESNAASRTYLQRQAQHHSQRAAGDADIILGWRPQSRLRATLPPHHCGTRPPRLVLRVAQGLKAAGVGRERQPNKTVQKCHGCGLQAPGPALQLCDE